MITKEYNDDLRDAFEAIDNAFFKGKKEHPLPPCLVSFARIQKVCCTGRTYLNLLEDETGRYGNKTIQFIELSTIWLHRDKKELLATLMHELGHAYETAYIKVARNGYHTKTWQALMQSVGLECVFHNSSRTSAEVSIIPNGDFDVFTDKFLSEHPNWVGVRETETIAGGGARTQGKKTSRKTKYECACGNKVWGKKGLRIFCPECGDDYESNDSEDEENED